MDNNSSDSMCDARVHAYKNDEHINGDIMNLLAAGDLIKLENLEQQKQHTQAIRKKLDEMKSQNDNQSSAVF